MAKAIFIELPDGSDARSITHILKEALYDKGVTARFKTFEDAEHLKKSLLFEARQLDERKLIDECIEKAGLFTEDEGLRVLLSDTALFYRMRYKEKIDKRNVEKVIQKALADVKVQLNTVSERNTYEKKTITKENSGNGGVQAIQQTVVSAG